MGGVQFLALPFLMQCLEEDIERTNSAGMGSREQGQHDVQDEGSWRVAIQAVNVPGSRWSIRTVRSS